MNDDLVSLIHALQGLRVLVVGDVILDEYLIGSATRLSREAPIPVLHGKSATTALGGAGNVVANIVSLGGRAVPLGVLGDDPAGRAVVERLAEIGVDTGGLAQQRGRMTSSKSRYSALNQQVLRFDEEEIAPLSGPARSALLSRFRDALAGADIVVLSDYGKGVLLDGVAQDTSVTLTATFGTQNLNADVRVLGAAEVPTTLTLTPATANVAASGTQTMTVTLDIPAPIAGAVVDLTQNPPGAGTIPPTLLIPGGQLSGTFDYVDGGTATSVDVTATYGALTDTSTLTIVSSTPGTMP